MSTARIGTGIWAALLVTGLVAWASGWKATAAESAVKLPPAAADAALRAGAPETAVLAGGCFWGVQGVFQHVKGVKSVLSGYAGGERATADYETVSTGTTGHAESVQIVFDPAQISYGEILRVYFSVAHDPTQLNRQGPDVGTQYRSSIFFANDEQKKIAASYIAQLDAAHVFAKPIVTRVVPLRQFYPAESYHQDYLVNHPSQPYIVFNDLPKVSNLKTIMPEVYRDAPVLALLGRGAGAHRVQVAPARGGKRAALTLRASRAALRRCRRRRRGPDRRWPPGSRKNAAPARPVSIHEW
jgi:peptide-methionine (S)-S-oxide reductase